jgi:hypothetical protein
MPNTTLQDLPQLAHLDEAVKIILSINYAAITKNKAMQLSEMIPNSIWQKLGQRKKGIVGKEFYKLHEELGFEYVGKGKSGTTNYYRLVTDIN